MELKVTIVYRASGGWASIRDSREVEAEERIQSKQGNAHFHQIIAERPEGEYP